jgi:polysaccharide biosynthesis protein PslH
MVAFDDHPPDAAKEALLVASGCTDMVIVSRPEPSTVVHAPRSSLRRVRARLESLRQRVRSPMPGFVQDSWSVPLVSQLGRLQRAEQFDLIYATQSWMAEQARAAGFDRIVVDVDDLLSTISCAQVKGIGWSTRSTIQRFDAAKETRYERSLPRRFEHVVVAKQQDLSFFPQPDRARVSVIPNGIFIPDRPLREARDSCRLLFVGTLGYGPNIDAVRWLATDIMPLVWRVRADACLDVAGFGSGAQIANVLDDPRCTIYESPPDLEPLYREAALALAPVLTGGGTRIKVLEALAFDRAMVCTTFAADGLGLRGGVDLEFADSAERFADRIIALLGDPVRRMTLASSGRMQVAEHFDWLEIERGLSELVARLSRGGASRS